MDFRIETIYKFCKDMAVSPELTVAFNEYFIQIAKQAFVINNENDEMVSIMKVMPIYNIEKYWRAFLLKIKWEIDILERD